MPSEKRQTYLPLFLNLNDQPCLVVGGGAVAQRKTEQLLEAGAKVTLISPQLNPHLKTLYEQGRFNWQQREYKKSDAKGYRLIIATTDDPEVNLNIYRDGEKSGALVNAVDQPQLCSAVFPSVIRNGPITIAISSSAKAPFLTKALRKKLEDTLSDLKISEHSDLLVAFRQFVRENVEDFEFKNRLYEKILNCDEKLLSEWAEGDPPYDLWKKWLKEEN